MSWLADREYEQFVKDVYAEESADYQRGYDLGWDHRKAMAEQGDWAAVPPLLRRFFWYGKDSFADDMPWWKWLYLRGSGTDEYCNRVFGVRFIGGVLWVRWNRKVRSPQDGICDQCKIEMEM